MVQTHTQQSLNHRRPIEAHKTRSDGIHGRPQALIHHGRAASSHGHVDIA
jgi:hypothetical protein